MNDPFVSPFLFLNLYKSLTLTFSLPAVFPPLVPCHPQLLCIPPWGYPGCRKVARGQRGVGRGNETEERGQDNAKLCPPDVGRNSTAPHGRHFITHTHRSEVLHIEIPPLIFECIAATLTCVCKWHHHLIRLTCG